MSLCCLTSACGACYPSDHPGCRRHLVLAQGCGTGQLGLPLAMAGAHVTLTDLEHIVPLTQQNIGLNAGSCAILPRAQPFMCVLVVKAGGLHSGRCQAACVGPPPACPHCHPHPLPRMAGPSGPA